MVFADPPLDEVRLSTETTDRGHGRIERRRLTTSVARHGCSDWPWLCQVFRLERSTIQVKTSDVRAETIFGVTHLDRAHVSVVALLRLARHP